MDGLVCCFHISAQKVFIDIEYVILLVLPVKSSAHVCTLGMRWATVTSKGRKKGSLTLEQMYLIEIYQGPGLSHGWMIDFQINMVEI